MENEKEEQKTKEEEEKVDLQEEINIRNILTYYFFDDKGKLRLDYPTSEELTKIQDYYIYVIKKNFNVEEYQPNFINLTVINEIMKLNEENKILANYRKVYIEDMLVKLIEYLRNNYQL